MRISSGVSNPSATIRLGSSWLDHTGVEIEVTGPADRNQFLIAEFDKAFGGERDYLLSFLSMPTILITLIVIFVENIGLGFLTKGDIAEILSWFSKPSILHIISYLVLFWLMPLSCLWLPVEALLTRWMGSAIFYWGDGVISYRKKESIIKALFFIISIGVFGSLIANKIQI